MAYKFQVIASDAPTLVRYGPTAADQIRLSPGRGQIFEARGLAEEPVNPGPGGDGDVVMLAPISAIVDPGAGGTGDRVFVKKSGVEEGRLADILGDLADQDVRVVLLDVQEFDLRDALELARASALGGGELTLELK